MASGGTFQLRSVAQHGPLDSQGGPPAEERIEPGFAQDTIEHLFEFSPDAILVTDGEGVMRAANPRAEELFGYTSQELIGQPVEMLVPARFRGGHPRHRENYNAAPRARQMGAAMNLFGLRKDGSEFPVDIMLEADSDRSRPGGGELHPRRNRAARRAGSATAERPPPSVDSSRALASMPSICSTATATSSPGTPAPSASRATRQTKFWACTFRASSRRRIASAATPPTAAPGCRKRARGRRRLARAQRWLALLGQRRDHRDPRQHWRGHGIRQSHPRRDRPEAGAGVGDRRAQRPAAGQRGHSQDAGRVFRQHPADGSP